MFHNFNKVSCRLRVLLAAHGKTVFFEKVKQALQDASSTDMPVFVENWYETVKKEGESVEACAIILITELMMEGKEGEIAAEVFEEFLPRLVGKSSPLGQETIIVLHEKEGALLKTLCDAFGLEVKGMRQAAKAEGLSYFSLADDFARSRYQKAVLSFALRAHEEMNAKPLDMAEPETSLDGPERFILVVDSDKDQADGLQSFLTYHAKQQNIDLKVCVRHSVADAIRCMKEINPLVVSIRPNLTEQWDGLEIMSTAKQFGIPVVIRSRHGAKQIQGALNQRRIVARPTKVVNENLLAPWVEAMMACLISPTQH